MTLGTNTNSNISAFRSVLDGLSDLAVEVVITVGFDGDPASFGPEPANAHIERYVPHSLLLPECTLSICHGGLGTTLGSLAKGLPLLLLPQGADQYSVSQLVFEAGAGLVLRPADVNPAAVRSGVLTLLNEPTYREAAHRLQVEIAAMPGPEDAVHLLETANVHRCESPNMGSSPRDAQRDESSQGHSRTKMRKERH
jgi:UDP:flavonoid glycosyltransferase YjiC (YdhE family)